MKGLLFAITMGLLLAQGVLAADRPAESFLSEDEVTLDRLEQELPPVRGAGVAGRAQRPLPKVNVLLTFAPNSTALSEKGMKALRVLAEAMDDMWVQFDFVVEGHADPIGSKQANLLLSQRRAEKVQQTLVEFGVSADRLKSIGKGDRELVNTDEPRDPKNRRVVFQPRFPG